LSGRKLDASQLTFEAFREAALRYLDRSDASVAQLRRVLMRRVARAADPALQKDAAEQVELVLVRLLEARLLDDARFALAYAEGQRRRGASTLGLRSKLRARGLDEQDVEAAVSSTSESDLYNEEQSAMIYARKRRLVTRFDVREPKQRQKALASLARRGFSFDVAHKVLTQLARETLDAEDA
jgi:regulatory protein